MQSAGSQSRTCTWPMATRIVSQGTSMCLGALGELGGDGAALVPLQGRLAQDGAADVAFVVGQDPDQGALRAEAHPFLAGLGQVLGHDQQFVLGLEGHDGRLGGVPRPA